MPVGLETSQDFGLVGRASRDGLSSRCSETRPRSLNPPLRFLPVVAIASYEFGLSAGTTFLHEKVRSGTFWIPLNPAQTSSIAKWLMGLVLR